MILTVNGEEKACTSQHFQPKELALRRRCIRMVMQTSALPTLQQEGKLQCVQTYGSSNPACKGCYWCEAMEVHALVWTDQATIYLE